MRSRGLGIRREARRRPEDRRLPVIIRRLLGLMVTVRHRRIGVGRRLLGLPAMAHHLGYGPPPPGYGGPPPPGHWEARRQDMDRRREATAPTFDDGRPCKVRARAAV